MQLESNSNKKIVVLFTRFFYPDNSGFGNAATALAESISKYSDFELVVVTHAQYVADGELDLSDTKVLSTWGDTSFLSKIFGNTNCKNFLFKIKLGWFYYFVSEIRQFSLAKKYLKSNELAAVFFETNTYPFIGEKIVDLVPNKVAIRFHAAEDTEELVYGGLQKNFSFIKKIRFGFKRRSIIRFSRKCRYIVSTNTYYNQFFKDVLMGGNVYDIWDKNYYGVIPNTLRTLRQSKAGQEKLDVDIPPKYCLTLGRLDEVGWLQKGFDDLFSAINELKIIEKLPEDFHLVVVGDGQQKSKLANMIDRINIKENVTHITRTTREQTETLLAGASYVILPSRFEGQSMFLTESLAMGIPIISTHETGSSDMIVPGENGFLVQKGDIDSLKDSILEMESKSSEELYSMRQYSKNIYQKKYSQKVVANNFQKLIDVINLHR